ncbi:SRPBCC family protein [Streptomyces sp. NPDC017979]|uniref:SRPBCC family protein n=1 Tax=Streptomyces sp. NPDC017979 TaxID=3365024 RepID=UPI00378C4972
MTEPTAVGSIQVSARPRTVYGLISDPAGRGRPLAVGERFRAVRRTGPYVRRRTATVTRAVADRCFAYRVSALGRPVATWRYDIVPTAHGCRVTGSTRDWRGPLLRALVGLGAGALDRAARGHRDVEWALTALKAAAEEVERSSAGRE